MKAEDQDLLTESQITQLLYDFSKHIKNSEGKLYNVVPRGKKDDVKANKVSDQRSTIKNDSVLDGQVNEEVTMTNHHQRNANQFAFAAQPVNETSGDVDELFE